MVPPATPGGSPAAGEWQVNVPLTRNNDLPYGFWAPADSVTDPSGFPGWVAGGDVRAYPVLACADVQCFRGRCRPVGGSEIWLRFAFVHGDSATLNGVGPGAFWSGVRAAEGTALEMRCAGNCTGGSNPSRSVCQD